MLSTKPTKKPPGLALALAVLAIAVLSIAGVWGFTSSTIKNEAALTISDSKNALIAVDVQEKTVTITQGVTDVSIGTITNNMSVYLDNLIVTGLDKGSFQYQPCLLPGQSTPIGILISPQEEIGLHTFAGKVLAHWEGGRAEIEFTVNVQVIEPPPSEENPGESLIEVENADQTIDLAPVSSTAENSPSD